jgi:hypothetical protein
VRAVVLRPAVTRDDGGGGMRWPKLMVETVCAVAKADGGGDVRACG